MKKTTALLVIFLLLFSLAACGGKVDPSDPNQGLWTATTCEMMGLTMDVGDFFGEGFTIELQSNGKCALNVDGEKANGKWTLAGGALTVEGGGLDCAGRLENGLLTLENVLDMGLTIVFEKEGGPPASAPASEPAAEPAPEPAAQGDAGYYVIDSTILAGETIGSELLPAFGMDGYYVVLNEDGTTELHTDTVITGTWVPGTLTYVENGEEVVSPYTLDGDMLSIEFGSADATLIFKRSGGAAPASAPSADAENLSDLQRQWNGTWYGFMMFNSGTGAYEDGAADADMYMVVDVDADGSGSFTVYSAYSMGEWGKGACIAREDVLEVVEGELTSSPEPMVPADWTFYRVQDSENKIVNTTDFVDVNGDTFNSSLFFKPWGADWQDEIDTGRSVYPPGYDDYAQKIINGEPSPFDGGGIGGAPASAEPTQADVMVGLTFEELDAALEAYGMTREMTTYEDLASYFGVPGERDDEHSGDTFSVSWYAADDGYATVFFDKATGLYTSWSTSGFGRPDGWEG